MTELHVPAGSIAGMVFSLVVAWGLPLALLILIRRKQKADMLPFFLGCGSFFLFAMLLEQLMHSLVLLKMGPVSKALSENLWLYALYGGLAAGLFFLGRKAIRRRDRTGNLRNSRSGFFVKNWSRIQ